MSSTRDSLSGFVSSREHLRCELQVLALLLKRELLSSMDSTGRARPIDEFAGLYVSEEEIRRDLEADEEAPSADAAGGPGLAIEERLRAACSEVDRRVAATQTPLRLPLLARRFGLSDTEIQILLLCIAPDVDVRFHRWFAYMQNDVGKKRPSVQFIAHMCARLDDVLDTGAVIGPAAPLVRHRLLDLSSTAGAPLPVQQPVVPAMVLDFLCGQDRIDQSLMAHAELVDPRQPMFLGCYGCHHDAVRESIVRQFRVRGLLPLAYVGGPPGSQRARLVEAVAQESGHSVLRMRMGALSAASEPLAALLSIVARDARLHHALVHLEDVDELLVDETRLAAHGGALRAWLARERALPVMLTGCRAVQEVAPELGVPTLAFEIPYPGIAQRAEIWSELLRGAGGAEVAGDVEALAAKFRFTPGQIHAAVRAAAQDAAGKPGEVAAVTADDLHRCARAASNQRLLRFARKIVPAYGWEDLVLPVDTTTQLGEICSAIRHRATVFGRWGFESKFSVGNGLNVLFAGPSGTGKTMSAEVIAGELGLDLYKIELSCVVSKYVGETERNLEKIFGEAETSNSILFFDEADALFGKRSEVKDAHDRYANIEINYLLQKLDDYEGVVVLATNFKSNIDAAFMRRLAHVVDFPSPDVELRQRIWNGVFPQGVPFAGDVDIAFLARQFQLSGGHIKNIALNSAFMAAQDDGPLRMVHLLRATKREYEKLGKLCSKSEFGPYLRLLRSAPEGS